MSDAGNDPQHQPPPGPGPGGGGTVRKRMTTSRASRTVTTRAGGTSSRAKITYKTSKYFDVRENHGIITSGFEWV